MKEYKEIYYEFLNNSYSGIKLKETRKNLNLTLDQLANKINVPASTLQKYEAGIIKKIPREIVLKLCELSNEKEDKFLNFSSIKLYNSLLPVLACCLDGMEFHKLNLSDNYYEKLGIDRETLKKVSELREVEQRENLLTKEEQREYKRFLKLVEIVLDMKKDEIKDKEYQDILFSLFFFHQLRKKSKILEE